jgi:glycosyltransferase involved in cell wall biosynthesis
MKVIINNSRISSVYFEGNLYDTGVPVELSFEQILRLKQKVNVKVMNSSDTEYNPFYWEKSKIFGFLGNVDSESGWGNVSYNLIKYTIPSHDLRWTGEIKGNIDSVMKQVIGKRFDQDMGMVYHEQPKHYWSERMFGKNIAILPFETSRVPASWVPKLNQMDAVLVPCVQNIGMMKDSGVTVPVDLIHWGVDETMFSKLERPSSSFFTFGTLGALSVRKGTDMLVDAFSKAFPKHIKDVRLICKTPLNYFPFWNKDPRILIDMSAVKHSELIENFFRRIDCFVYPTRGEGFGLPPLEAMATGVPAITTNWSGPVEYNNNEIGWMLDYTMTPAEDFKKNIYHEDCGDWAQPNEDQLIEYMRYCYEHQGEVKKKGEAVAQYVLDNWLWKDKIKMFHEALNKYL